MKECNVENVENVENSAPVPDEVVKDRQYYKDKMIAAVSEVLKEVPGELSSQVLGDLSLSAFATLYPLVGKYYLAGMIHDFIHTAIMLEHPLPVEDAESGTKE
jgi:hypothetical protein